MKLIKWAGGKSWLVEQYGHLLPASPRRYREPFLGGGAVADHYIGRVPCSCGLKLGHAVLLRTSGPCKDTERAYTLEDFFAEWKVVVG